MSHDPAETREETVTPAGEAEAEIEALPDDVLGEVAGGFCSVAYCSWVEPNLA